MGLRDKFKASSKLEQDGINLDLGECIITLSRAGGSNVKYNAAVERFVKQHKRAIDNDLLSNDKFKKILYEIYANTIVKDWKTRTGGSDDAPEYETGIEGPDGDLLPFTSENVIATFLEMPDLFIECKTTAESLQYYRQSLLDDNVKN